MSKISVSAFRSSVADEAAASLAARNAEVVAQYETMRVKLECQTRMISSLVYAARGAAAFVDFPTRISLGAPNGHNAGLVLALEDGVWRTTAEGDAQQKLKVMSDALIYGCSGLHASHALAAMGETSTPGSIKALDDFVFAQTNPLDGIQSFLQNAARSIPPHSLAAAVAVLRNVRWARSHQSPSDFACTKFIHGMRDFGVRHDVAPAGVASALSALAIGRDRHLLTEVLVETPHDSPEMVEAAWLAMKAGRTVHCQMICERARLPLDLRNGEGETLLHAVAEGVSASSDLDDLQKARETVTALIEGGVDPSACDRYGRLPSDYLPDYDSRSSLSSAVSAAIFEIEGALVGGAPRP